MSGFISDELIVQAADTLRRGGLVAFPTETVYGLGANARNAGAVQRIFETKGRPSSNPLIVHVASFEDVLIYSDLSKSFDPELVGARLRALSGLWPGPLSVVVPKAACIPDIVSAGGPTVAIRIPRHPVALRLLEAFGGPIAAPSANQSEYISPTTAKHVRDSLGDRVDLILDGGPCTVGLESTVLSLLSEPPVLLRPGSITREEIGSLLGVDVCHTQKAAANSSPLLSPGLLAKHYAPKTKVILRTPGTLPAGLHGQVGAICFTDETPPFDTVARRHLSNAGDLTEVAVGLFAALRELDQLGLEVIVVDTCDRVGLGEAIMDRLLRAAA